MEMSKVDSGANSDVAVVDEAAAKVAQLSVSDEVHKDDSAQDQQQTDGSLLQPGTKIRPEIRDDDVRNLAQRLYGITIDKMIELPAYDDRNYFIMPDGRFKNPIITHNCPHGYVLKVLNALDSKKIAFIDAQTKMMRFVNENGIACPRPVANVYGKMYSVDTIRGSDHVIRLLEYLPGKVLQSVPYTDHLFYQTGVFIGNFDRTVKKFEHAGYATHKTIWMLDHVGELEKFVYVLKDEEKQMLVEEVLEQFRKKVQPKLHDFQRGLIHGDFNEFNVLVTQNDITKEHYVSGILDFGDTSISNYVFEVAIAMTYMMLTSGDLRVGGLVLAGYESVRLISQEEKNVLKVSLCLSILYTYTTYRVKRPELDH